MSDDEIRAAIEKFCANVTARLDEFVARAATSCTRIEQTMAELCRELERIRRGVRKLREMTRAHAGILPVLPGARAS
jgi:hypothetical protein